MLNRLWTGWRRVVESEIWAWNWRVVVTYINSADPESCYVEYRHRYSGRVERVYG